VKALRNYRPDGQAMTPDTQVSLFVASQEPREQHIQAWRERLGSSLQVHALQGDHVSIVSSAHIAALGAALLQQLRSGRSSSAS